MSVRFWLRWSERDLRKRLFQVVAIAGIIALGSGIYAGLGSTSVWRRQSLDASFAQLKAHDIDVSVAPGFSAPQDELLDAVRSIGGTRVAHAEARLVANLPVRAGPDASIPAAGVIVGVDLSRPITVDRWKVTGGSPIGAADADGDDVLLDEHFTRAHHLPPTGTVLIAGTPVRYVGTALETEYLNTTTTFGATIQGAATRAIVYAPITLVQRLAGLPGQANDVALRVRPGTSIERLAASLSAKLPTVLPGVPTTVTVRSDDPMTKALYDEISSEQDVFNAIAVLILAGAGFAAFNLIRRVVESQRRDIGISMALGLPPRQISIRPMIMATEVAVAGVALGVLAGWGIGLWVLSIIKSQVPLPVWHSPWQVGLFLRAAALGLAIPLAGSAYPVWRAVSVVPTDAFLPPHLRSRRHWAGSSALRRLQLPGSTITLAPIRRIMIAPARSAMTVMGIGFIMTPLLALLGATDSISATIDTGTKILAGNTSDRLLVAFTSYQPQSSSVVSSVIESPLVGRHALGLDTGGYLLKGTTNIEVSISMVDLSDPLVVPTSLASRHVEPGGIVLSEKAASDLGLAPGETVVLRHPLSRGTATRFVDSVVPIRAVINSPYRFIAYMSLKDEPIMGLQGIINTVVLVPRHGVTVDQLQRKIAAMPGVAWALPASTLSNTIRDVLSLVTSLFIVLQIMIGTMAFLVAYNSSRIGSDERAREHATMMAFGLGVRRVVFAGVIESVLLGTVGIAIGIGLGLLVMQWLLDTVLPAAIPELSVFAHIDASSFLIVAAIGLAATASAPVLITRRLQKMNLPSTLRYVE